ncbi:MAG: 8-oxo-dGTP diphosphatase [Kiritimatiellia bacterium]|jgi:8-oxo-dGTP diphosphatase
MKNHLSQKNLSQNSLSPKQVHVAVGVLKNNQGKILVSKRAEHLHQGGLWEFPGGKVEQGESVFDALVREFQEEVNMTIQHAKPLITISHDYGDKRVLLDVWLSSEFVGEAKSNDNQLIEWVLAEDLDQYEFPKANQAIVAKLQLRT